MKIKRFSKAHYSGILILVFILLILQIAIFFVKKYDFNTHHVMSEEEALWLAQETELQRQGIVSEQNEFKIYPFNPNFTTDYKGYKMGMTVDEIDRLLVFRKEGKFVNSVQEFQKITKVSDQWLQEYSKYFKFPDWVNQKKNYSTSQWHKSIEKIVQKDINAATQEDLESVFMIGEKTALKILAEKQKLGAFVSLEQIENIWGISPEAILDLKNKFKILTINNLKKVNINDVSLKELSQFPYFNYYLAKNVITYRSMNGDFILLEDLKKVKDFPVEKFDYIKEYLEL